ncbi:hypothetical protein PPERSA_05598 [Pseudocohnilembus persalinus]|uniref:Uncharacterized protein n=1 Tax=Pseudocohnilembus persalinus TaxID=266149 RepID=A0A0V0Q7T7_PSEPJ|nr:hypothetical protein PPERSA_05598 [Pseudocohnilembus persalinus]|eukprot:KRW98254.1 hypothetical protein PPERSA_05598 [Pseudocohnilembus persalinus]
MKTTEEIEQTNNKEYQNFKNKIQEQYLPLHNLYMKKKDGQLYICKDDLNQKIQLNDKNEKLNQQENLVQYNNCLNQCLNDFAQEILQMYNSFYYNTLAFYDEYQDFTGIKPQKNSKVEEYRYKQKRFA